MSKHLRFTAATIEQTAERQLRHSLAAPATEQDALCAAVNETSSRLEMKRLHLRECALQPQAAKKAAADAALDRELAQHAQAEVARNTVWTLDRSA